MESRYLALMQESESKVLTEFFPTLSSIPDYIEPDFVETQFFTGHGAFATYLKRFRRANHDACKCDETSRQTVPHVLIHCHRFDHVREEEQVVDGEPYRASKLSQLICTRKRYRNFISTVRRIHPELLEEHCPLSHSTSNETTQPIDADLSSIFEAAPEGVGDSIATTANDQAGQETPQS